MTRRFALLLCVLCLLSVSALPGCTNNFSFSDFIASAFNGNTVTVNVAPHPAGTPGFVRVGDRSYRLNLRWAGPADRPKTQWDHRLALARVGQLPSTADLRQTGKFPAIYDQGNLGSCTANAGGGLIAYLDPTLPDPSRLQIYIETLMRQGTAGQDVGSSISGTLDTLAAVGACHEPLLPYSMDLRQTISGAALADAAQHRVTQWQAVAQDLDAMRSVLASGLPFEIGIAVYDSFEGGAVAATGNVPLPDKNSEQLLGGHALLVVGYDDGRQVFIVRNSWGPDWGDRGYCYIPYAYLLDQWLASDFQVGLKAGRVTDSTRLGSMPRSGQWPAVRLAHLRAEPACAWCGGTDHLQVHHIRPFHLWPALERVDSNLITLCERPGVNCHLAHGHLGDWSRYNPNIRADCLAHRRTLALPASQPERQPIRRKAA